LLQYDVWTRIHARDLWASHGDAVEDVLDRISFVELAPTVLPRALDPFQPRCARSTPCTLQPVTSFGDKGGAPSLGYVRPADDRRGASV